MKNKQIYHLVEKDKRNQIFGHKIFEGYEHEDIIFSKIKEFIKLNKIKKNDILSFYKAEYIYDEDLDIYMEELKTSLNMDEYLFN